MSFVCLSASKLQELSLSLAGRKISTAATMSLLLI